MKKRPPSDVRRAEPVALARVNGRFVRAVFMIDGVNSISYSTLADAMRHAAELPPRPLPPVRMRVREGCSLEDDPGPEVA